MSKEETKDAYKALYSKPHLIKVFLIAITDKNLGILASEHTWLKETCLDLLSNVNHPFIHLLIAIHKLDKNCTNMEVIACLADIHLPNPK